MGELALEAGPSGDGQWGVYLQSVFQLTLRTYFVSRFEHYDFPGSDPSVNLVTLGVAFRPLSGGVLTAEYLIADRTTPEGEPGIYASIGTLF